MTDTLPLKISIIIPTYKQAHLLGVTIESCTGQDYPFKEIIIADDNSPDDTAAVVAAFQQQYPDLIYHRNKKNMGRVGNYHHALYNYPSGTWVLFLDGDDHLFDNKFLSRAATHLHGSTDNDILFYKEDLTKESDGVMERHTQPAEKKIINVTALQWLKQVGQLGFSHLTTIYNVEYARQTGFYRQDLSSSDMASFFSMCLRYPDKRVIVSNSIGGVWVKHGQNTSSNLSFNETWRSSVGLYRGVTKHPVAIKSGIGTGWMLRNSVKPILYFFLKKLRLVG